MKCPIEKLNLPNFLEYENLFSVYVVLFELLNFWSVSYRAFSSNINLLFLKSEKIVGMYTGISYNLVSSKVNFLNKNFRGNS